MRAVSLTYLFCGLVFLAGGVQVGFAQKYPERGDIRKGNRAYEAGRYDQSETEYRRAAEKNPGSFEAAYNLGNALYRQGKWEAAEQVYTEIAAEGSGPQENLRTHFNNGNSLFQQRKLQEAMEEYKQALRIDPNDMEAKFNLAYVKKMLEDEDGDGGGDDDQNDDEDNDDDQGGGENKPDPGDGQNDPGDGDDNADPDQGDGDEGTDPQDGQSQQRPSGMTREEAENLLDAMQGNEDRAREKADEKKAGAVQRSEKNW